MIKLKGTFLARVLELVDSADLKSVVLTDVRVRFPPRAPYVYLLVLVIL